MLEYAAYAVIGVVLAILVYKLFFNKKSSEVSTSRGKTSDSSKDHTLEK